MVMARFAYRLLLVLIAFAVVGGPMGPVAQSAELMAPAGMADMPCDMTMPVASPDRGAPMAPCKGLTPDCIKQMGCVVNVALPARLVSADPAVVFSTVAYWSAVPQLAGLFREPEPLPPRTT
jgi:hypothetical protein